MNYIIVKQKIDLQIYVTKTISNKSHEVEMSLTLLAVIAIKQKLHKYDIFVTSLK